MAYNAFLQLATVTGESTDKNHIGWIEIYSFSWGASNPVSVSSGKTGLAGGKVSISSFNVMKKTESSTPPLFTAVCNGTHFATAVVQLCKAGDKQEVFVEYDFTEVMVESIQWSGSEGGDDTPTESVSFAFAKVTLKYSSQKVGGGMNTAVPASWDLTANAVP